MTDFFVFWGAGAGCCGNGSTSGSSCIGGYAVVVVNTSGGSSWLDGGGGGRIPGLTKAVLPFFRFRTGRRFGTAWREEAATGGGRGVGGGD